MPKEQGPAFASALQYHQYALRYGVYKESIARLVTMARRHLEAPQVVYDIACGTGMSTRHLAEAFPQAAIHGFDKSAEMVTIAREELGTDPRVMLEKTSIEDLEASGRPSGDMAFCNAAFWYFTADKALPVIRDLLTHGGVFAFNVSEPAIDFGDEAYDDRFLQAMVEVLDDRGIVFHREEGSMAGKLKLSYTPPTMASITQTVTAAGFACLETNVWEFEKPLAELADFYMIPGFGTKAFRELADEALRRDIIVEIVRRLQSQSVDAIRFRWAEFCFAKQ